MGQRFCKCSKSKSLNNKFPTGDIELFLLLPLLYTVYIVIVGIAFYIC